MYQIDGMRGYTGHFGAGKTLLMVRDLTTAHKAGAMIVTNFSFRFAALVLKEKGDFALLCSEIVARRESDPDLPKHIYIGLDEAGIYFAARDWANFAKSMGGNEGFDPNVFFLQLRKLGVQIFYTVQHPTLVDVNFRRCTTEWAYITRFFPGVSLVHHGFLPPDSPSLQNLEKHATDFLWKGDQPAHHYYDTHELVAMKKHYLQGEQLFGSIKVPMPDFTWSRKHLPTFLRWVEYARKKFDVAV
jgi:hypothetical protein